MTKTKTQCAPPPAYMDILTLTQRTQLAQKRIKEKKIRDDLMCIKSIEEFMNTAAYTIIPQTTDLNKHADDGKSDFDVFKITQMNRNEPSYYKEYMFYSRISKEYKKVNFRKAIPRKCVFYHYLDAAHCDEKLLRQAIIPWCFPSSKDWDNYGVNYENLCPGCIFIYISKKILNIYKDTNCKPVIDFKLKSIKYIWNTESDADADADADEVINFCTY